MISSGCNHPEKKKTSQEPNSTVLNEINIGQDTFEKQKEKSVSLISPAPPEKKANKKPSKRHSSEPSPNRYLEFPGDAHFNGKPMIQQEEIPKAIFEKNPDTLAKLAIDRYKSYDHFFPKSIADNFEEMKSTEHIHYPQELIFRFELFEKNAIEPYLIKEIVVKRNSNGELSAGN